MCGVPPNTQNYKIFRVFYHTGFHFSDRRQCSGSLLQDLGLTLLKPTWSPLTGYLYHSQLLLIHRSTENGAKAYLIVLQSSNIHLVYKAQPASKQLSCIQEKKTHTHTHTHSTRSPFVTLLSQSAQSGR